MIHILDHPFDAALVSRKKKSLKRELLEQKGLQPLRLALLGGATTSEIRDILELFLLRAGFRCEFYESDFGRWWEDAAFDNEALAAFKPQMALVLTSTKNLRRWPSAGESPEAVAALIAAEKSRFEQCWQGLRTRYGCTIIQNNFELPGTRLFGNMDAWDHRGRVAFVSELNRLFAQEAAAGQGLLLHDLGYVAASYGLDRWHDDAFWHLYKYAQAFDAIPHLAYSLACLIKAALGRSSKALVLDLDNTLWGGVIGDDGPCGIQIGKETAQAEAYLSFQRYAGDLKERGVLLAVASKNDMANALDGLKHPEGHLKPADFSAIKANWEPKDANLAAIAAELALGVDSFVFADDNPAEREIVRAQLPGVQVPEIGSDVARFERIIHQGGYFETVALSAEDLSRARLYAENAARQGEQSSFADYGEFLRSLEMKAEIRPFDSLNLDRITQLCNKTNQFNLTTRRYTEAEMQALLGHPGHITLYGRLADKFGDHGLVSLLNASIVGAEAHLDLWLMSCRVLKRGMEDAMFAALLDAARQRGVAKIVGTYLPTAKNAMVRGFYADLGFEKLDEGADGSTRWAFDTGKEPARGHFIQFEVGR